MLIPIILVFLSTGINFGTSCCAEKERISNLLETAIDLISKANSENISCPEEKELNQEKPKDCADLYRRGHTENGVYEIWPVSRLTATKQVYVYCDMNEGGWTVIQRRGDFGRPKDYFDQDWENYKEGFGDIRKDFWLGNDNIFALTNQKLYSVYFVLEDNNNNRVYAHYDNFWIDDEFNKYTLHISGYRGSAGDSMIPKHDGRKFSTKDQDNDSRKNSSCATLLKSGWWFNDCHTSNLNGVYNTENDDWGIDWHTWKPKNRNRATDYIRSTEIKIKPYIL